MIIEIKRATSTNRKQSKGTKFVSAMVVKVVNINQTSKFGKVEVKFEDEDGTRSINLCATRWRLPFGRLVQPEIEQPQEGGPGKRRRSAETMPTSGGKQLVNRTVLHVERRRTCSVDADSVAGQRQGRRT